MQDGHVFGDEGLDRRKQCIGMSAAWRYNLGIYSSVYIFNPTNFIYLGVAVLKRQRSYQAAGHNLLARGERVPAVRLDSERRTVGNKTKSEETFNFE
jgi:hypothetical protein